MMKENPTSFYERLGGRPVLESVHKIFYDKVYEHPWLRQFFAHVEQKFIESQQTDFMAGAFGGPKEFLGRAIPVAHMHIYIDKELFILRQALLQEALEEAGVAPDLILEWLRLDSAFEHVTVKKSVSDCKRRFKTQEIVIIPNPSGTRPARG